LSTHLSNCEDELEAASKIKEQRDKLAAENESLKVDNEA